MSRPIVVPNLRFPTGDGVRRGAVQRLNRPLVDNAYIIAALWIGLALAASLISIRVGISVALVEIALRVVGGNALGLQTTPWIDFLAVRHSACPLATRTTPLC